jgi:ABC-type branched-subunit amino acid transport system ATPase component
LFAAVNLRDTKPGRAFFAVRGSEVAAASLGINVTRTKLLAFAFSGFVAGIAGNLLMVQQRTVVPSQFSFAASVFFLSMMVVGGQASVGGAVASAVLFAGLREVFFRVTALGGYLDLVSVGLLTIVLLGYQGGLAALGGSIRRRLHRLGARRGAAPSGEEGPDAEVRRLERPAADRAKERERRSVVLQAAEVSVRFGGLLAADQVSLNVREGEIVGLIGPNGAGKTTVFNAISGLVVPTSGSVHVLGTDATALPVHERARLGLGRTFQVLQLFPQLTVMENLMVATHMENHTSTLANLVVTRAAARREQAARAHVREVLSMLGLSDVADRQVAGLPFGILRIVELARGLVTRARVLMLDEIASGLDNNETDRLMGLLEDIRARFGVSILLIEHDVRMVTSVSDYMYVLERGRIIAEGTPEEIRRDEKVVSAYLGESVA